MIYDLECELDTPAPAVVRAPVPAAQAFLAVPESEWTWRELRDYVVSHAEIINGPIPRDPVREKGIFSGFLKRHGSQAPAIARFAFEFCGGMWHNAPVTPSRFTEKSDPYFAQPILERLHTATAA